MILLLIPIITLLIVYLIIFLLVKNRKRHLYFYIYPILSYVAYFVLNVILVEILKLAFHRPRPFQTRNYNRDVSPECALYYRKVFNTDKQSNPCKLKDVKSTPSGHNNYCVTCIYGTMLVLKPVYRYLCLYQQELLQAGSDEQISFQAANNSAEQQAAVDVKQPWQHKAVRYSIWILYFALLLLLVIFESSMLLSRIVVAKHYFSDVVLGAASGLLGSFLITCFEPQFQPEKK